ncbi:MAG: glycoside hydrolase family 88 protein [Nannocystaceae bacterium]
MADRYLRRHPPATWRWSWQTAILTVGVLRLDAVDDQRDWAGLLAEHYTARPAPPIRRPDDCAPALGAALLLAQGVEEARPALERVAAYVHAAPRNRLGALDHLDPGTPLGRLYPASIWIDSMVMYATTAAWVGRALGDEALLTFAHAQPAIFAAHLQDPSTGLFRHAYLHHRDRTHPLDDVFWLRGNGWAALALVELLDTMDPRGPEHLSTRTILRRLATGLHEHRRRDGTWPTVLDARRRGVRDESSGSALVAYALAKGARLGLLPAWHRDEARVTLRTLERRLRPSRDGPILTGTSTSTVPSRRAGYVAVPRRADVSYGVGAYLLLAAELRAAE